MPAYLPEWVPSWVQLVLLVLVVLVAGAYALMPFSVFGIKARLDALDDRLDALQSDLRALTNRLPDPEMRNPAAWRRGAPEEDGLSAPSPMRRDRPPPPVPEPAAPPVVATPPKPRRSEPQLNWPENRPRR